jgi:hypothetical protein
MKRVRQKRRGTVMKNGSLRYLTIGFLLLGIVWVEGCSEMSPTQQRVLSGGALGAAGGAAIGAMAGNAGMGALIGAGVGAGGGYLYDRHQQAKETAYQQGYQQGRQSQ